MKPLAILAALGLAACTPGTFATVSAVVSGAHEAYEFCQERGLDVAEMLDPLTPIDGPGRVRVICGPDE